MCVAGKVDHHMLIVARSIASRTRVAVEDRITPRTRNIGFDALRFLWCPLWCPGSATLAAVTPNEAEEAAAERLRGWGYEVEELEPNNVEKVADFRLRAPGESWVMDVKARQADYGLEKQIAAQGGMPEIIRRPEAEKVHPKQFLALDQFHKAEKQVASTREPGELGAMWLVASERVGMTIDPEQLRCALLGYRQIIFRGELRPVYAVYPPEFGSVIDVVMVQHTDRSVEAVVNPWTDDARIAATRASLMVRSAERVHDAKAELSRNGAWLAPDEPEARRLAELHLAERGSRREVDRFEGRARRDWQVELALRQLYGELGVVGGFLRITEWSSVHVVPYEALDAE